VFFDFSKKIVISKVITLYLRGNGIVCFVKKGRFFWDTSYSLESHLTRPIINENTANNQCDLCQSFPLALLDIQYWSSQVRTSVHLTRTDFTFARTKMLHFCIEISTQCQRNCFTLECCGESFWFNCCC